MSKKLYYIIRTEYIQRDKIMANERKLKSPLIRISKSAAGYSVNAPHHKCLVLGGGGAKGITYLGFIKSAEERGLLEQITHISGASAGAMTASLLAVGMDHNSFNILLPNLDIGNLLDSSGISPRAKGDRFRNTLDLMFMVQIMEHLNNLDEPISSENEKNYFQLSQKIALYQKALADEGVFITSVEDIIALSHEKDSLNKVDKAFKNLPQQMLGVNGEELENPKLTFGDLKALREILPQAEKHKIKNLSIVVTNQTTKELETFSENDTHNHSLAQAVQWSGAHPVLFTPGINAKGESMADGGIIDNMPELKEFDREEVLCVTAEANSSFYHRVYETQRNIPQKISRFQEFMDHGIQFLIGGKHLASTASIANREQVFHHHENMVYLNSGEIVTTNMTPTESQKQAAIENGYNQTEELLDNRDRTFDNPLTAMLYVGVNMLDESLIDENSDKELFEAAAQAKMITSIQEHIVEELDNKRYRKVTLLLKQIEDIMLHDAGLNPIQKEKAYSLCIKQINFLSEGVLEQHLSAVVVNQLLGGEKDSFLLTVLKALLAPIKWILSKFNSPAPEITVQMPPSLAPNSDLPNENSNSGNNIEHSGKMREQLAKLKDGEQDELLSDPQLDKIDDENEEDDKSLKI